MDPSRRAVEGRRHQFISKRCATGLDGAFAICRLFFGGFAARAVTPSHLDV